ncbi:hypothetical protein GCM10011579_016650 [Streptomyces albiflavescens]|uniref:Uncharacterized protein n=1 Tax=Streptomyces albiflavescens TaxID=1623582 RepID=A0A917XXE6_9ACTN|nr:hypothetical protein GCM10011579_016650 [Streptomyces albiflavescens]
MRPQRGGSGSVVVHIWDCPDAPADGDEVDALGRDHHAPLLDRGSPVNGSAPACSSSTSATARRTRIAMPSCLAPPFGDTEFYPGIAAARPSTAVATG